MTVMTETLLAPRVAQPFAGPARWLGACALAIGGALQLAEALLEPESSNNTQRLAWWAAHQDRMDWSQAVGILALPFLVLGAIVIWRLAKEQSPRIAAVGVAMMTTAMIGLGLVHGVELSARWAALAGHTDAAKVILEAKDPRLPGAIGMIMFLPVAIIGVLLMSVALWRSRQVPRVTGLLLAAFAVIDFAVDQEAISHAALVAAGIAIAWAVFSGYSREPRTNPRRDAAH